jgi:DNA (cytosine-5)-methyltransferase 1
MPDFYEFFAGGGMVRAGLGQEWRCLFANDFDHKKSRIYRDNWGEGALLTEDVGVLTTDNLSGHADLAWASFPCQDLSLAGGGAGLKGDRSGTFRPFWRLIKGLVEGGRAPHLIVLENVCGTLTSHDGKDFTTICSGFQALGYSVGALVIDAVLFVPQSRPRLFIIGVHSSIEVPSSLIADAASIHWHPKTLTTAYEKLPQKVKRQWLWWRLPAPAARVASFADLLEDNPKSATWFTAEETRRLLSMMSEINRTKVEKAKRMGRRMVGAIYKRTRRDEYGRKVQRAEIRFDDVAGCLRTPAGGSSRQLILVVEGHSVRARLLSSRETARLMGLPDDYTLPENYNEAYHLTGDGVVVPVVRHLAEHIFEPILDRSIPQTMAAA